MIQTAGLETCIQRRSSAARAVGERGHLARWADQPGLELLTADYKHHAYVPHWHDTYTVALVAAGCETVRCAGSARQVTPGDILLLNPGDVHDGEAFDPGVGWAFRVFYLAQPLLDTLFLESGTRGSLFAQSAAISNPEVWRSLLDLHATLSRSGSLLKRSSSLFTGIAKLRAHFSRISVSAGPDRSSTLGRARDYLHAGWAEPVSLDQLAGVAGMSRFHFLREFKKSYGLPPHAYQLQLRALQAKEMLFQGMPLNEVALSVGLYDQAHLTNVLKRYVGVTPGA